MDERDDARLDALVRQAAPDAGPAGLADRAIAATRARLARRRLTHLVAAAAAALAVGAAARLWLECETSGAKPIALSAVKAPLAPEPIIPTSTPTFAVLLPSEGPATHRVIVGRFDGRLVLFARPNPPEPGSPRPAPRALAATVSCETLE